MAITGMYGEIPLEAQMKQNVNNVQKMQGPNADRAKSKNSLSSLTPQAVANATKRAPLRIGQQAPVAPSPSYMARPVAPAPTRALYQTAPSQGIEPVHPGDPRYTEQMAMDLEAAKQAAAMRNDRTLQQPGAISSSLYRAPQETADRMAYRTDLVGTPMRDRMADVMSPYGASDAARFGMLNEQRQTNQQAADAAYAAGTQKARGQIAANNADMQERLGIEDPHSIRNELTNLAAKYASYKKGGGELSQSDFYRAMRYQGDMSEGASNYLSQYYDIGSRGKDANFGGVDLEGPMNAYREARREAASGGYQPGMTAAQKDGKEWRRAMAREQATISSRVSGDVARGIPHRTSAIYRSGQLDNQNALQQRQAYELQKAQEEQQAAIGLERARFGMEAEQAQADRQLAKEQAKQEQMMALVESGAVQTPSQMRAAQMMIDRTLDGKPMPTADEIAAMSPEDQLAARGGASGIDDLAAATQQMQPEEIKRLATSEGIDLSPNVLRENARNIMNEADAYARAESRKRGLPERMGNSQGLYESLRNEYLASRKDEIDFYQKMIGEEIKKPGVPWEFRPTAPGPNMGVENSAKAVLNWFNS